MAKVKAKEGERLDDEHVEKVIKHLEAGGKKKDAYGILNIRENASRLNRIIEEYHERKALSERLRKANRGKPATKSEIQTIINGALEGTAIGSIAEDLYRSVDFVKKVIHDIGIPQKTPGSWWDRRKTSSIPDKCVTDSFSSGEIVWSEKYNGLAIVLEPGTKTTHIYVIEKIEEEPTFAIGGKVYTGYGGHHAWQRNEELGTLKHLSEYGVDIYKPYISSFPRWLSGQN